MKIKRLVRYLSLIRGATFLCAMHKFTLECSALQRPAEVQDVDRKQHSGNGGHRR
jgi:hypothetical protein